MSNNILILGNGYIGNHLYNTLAGTNKVSLISKKQVNYNSREEFQKYLELNPQYRDGVIINCSGFCGKPNVDQAEIKKEECWELNVIGPTCVNNVCREFNIPYIHISSGCIYTGYDKVWTEADTPNFGIFNKYSSFYSKSKHAYELANSEYGLTIRIRMPFDNNIKCKRSILHKILKYSDIIDFRNSKTYVPDLCKFIDAYITQKQYTNDIVNFVNPDALFTREVVDLLCQADLSNSKWRFVSMDDLPIKAERSNCIISHNKLINNYNFNPHSEIDAIKKVLQIS